MKSSVKSKLLLAVVLLIASVLVLAVLEDKCETYDPISFLGASTPWFNTRYMNEPSSDHITIYDKIIVMAALEKDNVTWVANDLPSWKHAIYIVNPTYPPEEVLTTSINKGHEGMAYLTYIIDNYNSSISSIVAFLHPHRNGFFEAWHVDTPLHDNVVAMRNLQLDYVKEMGYVNLRCNFNPGCKRITRLNQHLDNKIWREIFGGTSTPMFVPDKGSPAAASGTSMVKTHENWSTKLRIWTPCCAQFATTSERIYERPLEDYVKIRQWLINTEKDDAHSGRVMEYLWHVIFGKEAIL